MTITVVDPDLSTRLVLRSDVTGTGPSISKPPQGYTVVKTGMSSGAFGKTPT